VSTYTPTTEEVRHAYWSHTTYERVLLGDAASYVGGEFDRWLAAHDAEVRAAAEQGTEEPEGEWLVTTTLDNGRSTSSGVTDEETARAIMRWSEEDGLQRELYRRRKAGPWMPVEQEGETDEH